MHTLKVNDLVYYDAFLCGLIKAKITGYSSDGLVTVKLTQDARAHSAGEQLAARPNDVIPRSSVYTRNGHIRVRGTWRFEGLPEHQQPRWATA